MFLPGAYDATALAAMASSDAYLASGVYWLTAPLRVSRTLVGGQPAPGDDRIATGSACDGIDDAAVLARAAGATSAIREAASRIKGTGVRIVLAGDASLEVLPGARVALHRPVSTDRPAVIESVGGNSGGVGIQPGGSLTVDGPVVAPRSALDVAVADGATVRFLDTVIVGAARVALGAAQSEPVFATRTPTDYLRTIAITATGEAGGSGEGTLLATGAIGPNPPRVPAGRPEAELTEYRMGQ